MTSLAWKSSLIILLLRDANELPLTTLQPWRIKLGSFHAIEPVTPEEFDDEQQSTGNAAGGCPDAVGAGSTSTHGRCARRCGQWKAALFGSGWRRILHALSWF